MPLTVLEHDECGPSPTNVATLMDEHGALGLVIGLPLCMNGSASSQTMSALALAQRISAYLNTSPEVPPGLASLESLKSPAGDVRRPAGRTTCRRVILWDERLSSWDANRAVHSGRGSTERWKRRKRILDAHAAAIILQSFLDTFENA